mgnify:CR=1 FL=1|tara:strand:+ start:796 stop:1107 length:312 start_codon:yes stop_codon:yes gene_type:complete
MKSTNDQADGTSFFDVKIIATPNQLISLAKKLGADYYDCNYGTDKVNFDFIFETSKGDVFTVYDWKAYKPLNLDKYHNFHIGALSFGISLEAREELHDEFEKL